MFLTFVTSPRFCLCAAVLSIALGCEQERAPVDLEPVIAAPVATLVFEEHQVLPDILTYTLDDCERRPQNARRPTSFPLLYEDEREALSNLLIAAGEDKLSNFTTDRDGSPDRIIRFMWLPSFDPAVIVRLTKTSDQNWHINAVRLALESDSETVVARTERILSGAESDRLSQILEFDLPLDNPAKGCVGPDLDGSRWIAEGIEGDIYKYVDRASGDKEPLRRLGLEALHLTGWELGQIY